MPAFRIRTIAVFLFLVFCSAVGNSYSVLTHEEIVDLLWRQKIQPLLLKRFPDATEEDLRKAHAYAYGGCVLQDMGYYPFGNKYFSDLVHYVRSGDFVAALIRDSSDLNEYAFALGALAHYASDVSGHPIINRITAIEFPKLARKYGKEVTYADDPKAHIRTEFGFDMVQVAKNRYTSDRYHDFIGFEVSRPLLERAFFETYYLKLEDVFGDVDMAIGSYRRGVSKFIPEMTRVALLSRHDQLVRENPNFNKKKFLYYLNRAGYEREWGTVYRKPGFGTRVLAFVLKIVPKFGPFRAVSFKIPTTQTEDMYIKSVDDTIENYSHLLEEVANNSLRFPNRDFDTGRETRAGEYVLTDKTYARLVDHLAKQASDPLSAPLRQNVLEFYGNLNDPIATKKNKKDWQKLQEELNELKGQCPDCQQQGHPSAEQ
ncbi:MAG TPA: zinc dependent phospholipase C family protein [Terriglobales bacterium]|nr:zinc dependent phospholipase C family protein [Terriglobales bacterium]